MLGLVVSAVLAVTLWLIRDDVAVAPRCFFQTKNVNSQEWRVGWDDGCGAVAVATLRAEIRRTGEQCAPAIAVGAPFRIVAFRDGRLMVNPRIVSGSASKMRVRYDSVRGTAPGDKRHATIHDAWVEVEYAEGGAMMETVVKNVSSGGDAECLQVAMADF